MPAKPQIERLETVDNAPHKFIIGKKGGDVALGLVHNIEELFEAFTPEEERRVMRKVDLLILPYLAVCYVFFFVGDSSDWSILSLSKACLNLM